MENKMRTDIRLPMGLMFLIIGAIIFGYGMTTWGDSMYQEHSLGIDVNVCWGSVLVLFGLVMLGLAWRAGKTAR
jgi:hypothetical protein